MIYEYILKNFSEGEPIFLNEIPGKSRDAVRQEIKRLVDQGKLKRQCRGIYFIPYINMLNEEGVAYTHEIIDKKYLYNKDELKGYYTGYNLVNRAGFTSQNPGVIEICSNAASTTQRKVKVEGFRLIIYKPKAPITKENISSLKFLDLMTVIKKYSEIKGDEYQRKLKRFIERNSVDFNDVKKYISLYPKIVYKNIYEAGLMDKLLWWIKLVGNIWCQQAFYILGLYWKRRLINVYF